MLADLVGWLAAGIGMILCLPQLIKLIRTRDTNGLSLVMWQIQAATLWSWFSHGVIYHQLNQIVSTAFAGATMLLIIVAIIRQRKLNPLTVFAPMLVGLAILVLIDLFFGRTAFGLIVIIPQIYSLYAQFDELRRAPSVSGFSPLYSIIGIVMQLLFLWWGFLIDDPAVVLSASTTALLHSMILTIWVRRRDGQPPVAVGIVDNLER